MHFFPVYFAPWRAHAVPPTLWASIKSRCDDDDDEYDGDDDDDYDDDDGANGDGDDEDDTGGIPCMTVPLLSSTKFYK